MRKKPASKRKGLSHEESKAQTRAKLIAVGRKHFVKHGFSNATADAITKEAGYTRGALHSNFGNKEGLLLEIARESHRAQIAAFIAMMKEHTGRDLIGVLREGCTRSLSDPNFVLMLEFEFEALRNKKLHAAFLEFHKGVVSDSGKILDEAIRDHGIQLGMEPEDIILAIDSLSRGLALRRMLLGSQMSLERSRRMMFTLFDKLVFYESQTPL